MADADASDESLMQRFALGEALAFDELYRRHELQVVEMTRRGYDHGSPLDRRRATGSAVQRAYVDSIPAQRRILRKKGCPCFSKS